MEMRMRYMSNTALIHGFMSQNTTQTHREEVDPQNSRKYISCCSQLVFQNDYYHHILFMFEMIVSKNIYCHM